MLNYLQLQKVSEVFASAPARVNHAHTIVEVAMYAPR